MALLLLLSWCRAVMRAILAGIIPVIPGSADSIADWVRVNSRLRLLRQFGGKALIWLTILTRMAVFGKDRKIPGSTGKTGIVDRSDRLSPNYTRPRRECTVRRVSPWPEPFRNVADGSSPYRAR